MWFGVHFVNDLGPLKAKANECGGGRVCSRSAVPSMTQPSVKEREKVGQLAIVCRLN